MGYRLCCVWYLVVASSDFQLYWLCETLSGGFLRLQAALTGEAYLVLASFYYMLYLLVNLVVASLCCRLVRVT